MKAPFPYFGGKSRVAGMVWRRFGDVPNYVEPFFGSGAILLGRPYYNATAGRFTGKGWRTETVNDASVYLTNFWRAVSAEPERVAELADWPVSEIDLHARHAWLRRGPKSAEFMPT